MGYGGQRRLDDSQHPLAVSAPIFASETCLDEHLVISIVALSICLGVPVIPWMPEHGADRRITSIWLVSPLPHMLTTSSHRRNISHRYHSDGGCAISARFSPSSRARWTLPQSPSPVHRVLCLTHHRQQADPSG